MADHRYVEDVVGWLNSEWDTTNYPDTFSGSKPAIIDGDDAESQSFNGRQVAFDLTENNAVEVTSTPTRQQRMIGTDYDYQFDDGVSVRVIGVHDDEWGHISGSDEFRALYQEVRRILHTHRNWPDRNTTGDQHTDTLWLADETNLSPQYKDLFEYNITALVRGIEELP